MVSTAEAIGAEEITEAWANNDLVVTKEGLNPIRQSVLNSLGSSFMHVKISLFISL